MCERIKAEKLHKSVCLQILLHHGMKSDSEDDQRIWIFFSTSISKCLNSFAAESSVCWRCSFIERKWFPRMLFISTERRISSRYEYFVYKKNMPMQDSAHYCQNLSSAMLISQLFSFYLTSLIEYIYIYPRILPVSLNYVLCSEQDLQILSTKKLKFWLKRMARCQKQTCL